MQCRVGAYTYLHTSTEYLALTVSRVTRGASLVVGGGEEKE